MSAAPMPLLPREVCDRVADTVAAFLRSYDRGDFGIRLRSRDGAEQIEIAELRRLLADYRALPGRRGR